MGGDAGDGAPFEPGQDMVAVVVPVDIERGGFPVSRVSPEDFVGDSLEGGVRRCCGLVVVSVADGSQQRPGPAARLVNAACPGVADDLPDPPAVVLAMDEVALGARGQDPDAEALSSRSRTA